MVLPKCSDMCVILLARAISPPLFFLMKFLLNLNKKRPMYLTDTFTLFLPEVLSGVRTLKNCLISFLTLMTSISEEEVFQTLTPLDPSKAVGCDGIGPKLCALALYQPLHHLFNLSLSQSYIPAEWRLHQIKPIFKSGDRCLVQNYRPIIISPVCFFEGIRKDSFLQFVNNKISNHQFGFTLYLHQLLNTIF